MSDDPRLGRSVLAGGAVVLLYSTASALVAFRLGQGAGPVSPDPAQVEARRLVLAGLVVQVFLQGPVMWIIGSGLLWCGLSALQRTRPFRVVLAATGVPFLAPALAMAAVFVALRCGLAGDRAVKGATSAGLAAMLVWTVLRLRRGGVDALRGAVSTLFAAGLYVLGRWLPTRLMVPRAK